MSMSTTTESPAVLEYRLSAADRCDSCGAQAYIAAEVNGSDLLFCAHHGAEFKEKLSLTALAWHDESAKLGSGRN